MAFDTFAPPRNPSSSSRRDVAPRVNQAAFGDGYSQRGDDGLNALPQTFQAQWRALTIEHADEIEAFLGAHARTAFLWTVPMETVERKWLAVMWSRGYPGGDTVSLTATLKEVFDL